MGDGVIDLFGEGERPGRGGIIAILLWSSLALLTTLTGDLPSLLMLAMGFGSIGAAFWLRRWLKSNKTVD